LGGEGRGREGAGMMKINGYEVIIKFVNRYGGYSMMIKSGKKTIHRHEFFFADYDNAVSAAEDVIRGMAAKIGDAILVPIFHEGEQQDICEFVVSYNDDDTVTLLSEDTGKLYRARYSSSLERLGQLYIDENSEVPA
jgi:hypothetical protein